MSWWESILLGVVQGATEFLPVSSSGHLVIVQALLGISIPGVFFEIAVHVATLLSVLVAYRARVARLCRGCVGGESDAWRYVLLLVLATIPAGFIGVFFKDAIEALFESPMAPGFALLVTGALLWSSRVPLKREVRGAPGGEPTEADAAMAEGVDPHRPRPPAMKQALGMGFAQAFALIPGISRSGSTVVAGLWLGVEATEAAAFSFLMAVPAIAGAAVLQIPEVMEQGTGLSTGVLLGGFIAAGVTGVLAIRTFVAMLRNRSFHHFATYCWLVGSAYLVYVWMR